MIMVHVYYIHPYGAFILHSSRILALLSLFMMLYIRVIFLDFRFGILEFENFEISRGESGIAGIRSQWYLARVGVEWWLEGTCARGD
jgi:hypothetical protein